jgi:hypothetical protein
MTPARTQLLGLQPGPELDEFVCRLLGGERKVLFPPVASMQLDESAETPALIAAGCDIGYAIPRVGTVCIIHAARPIERADAGERLFMPSRRNDHALDLIEMLAGVGLTVTVGKAVISVGDEGVPAGKYPLSHALALLGVLALSKRNRFVVQPHRGARMTVERELAWTRALEAAGSVSNWVKRAEAADASSMLTVDGFAVNVGRTDRTGESQGRLRITVRAPDRYNNSPAMWTALGRGTAKAFAGHSMLSGTLDPDALEMVFDIVVRSTSSPVLRAA